MSKIKYGTYLIYLDQNKLAGTLWIAIDAKNTITAMLKNTATSFDVFGVEHIPKGNKKVISCKNITNVCRIQVYDSIM